MTLIPTMWRTCRVLANQQRLRCLQAVLRKPNRFVSALAKELREPVPVVSQYLRDLQARGMLSVERRSRWVFYGDIPDATVGHAAPLLAAMRLVLTKDAPPLPHIQRILQGFTHPRRIAVLRVLARSEPQCISAIRRATSISEPALLRHLRKLEACGLVRRQEDQWTVERGLPVLAQRLLLEACGS
ncbi:MAG: ArsR family transcriptional regulator [Magnetococcus sp. WYHC-3]